MFEKDTVFEGVAIIRRQGSRKGYWFVKKNEETQEWDFPKNIARKGEASVRASIRMMAEQAHMDAQVIEEAGRSIGRTTVNGKSVPRRTYYYAMVQKVSGEILGFEYKWLEYAKAVRKLSTKKDRAMIKSARKILNKWQKEEDEENLQIPAE